MVDKPAVFCRRLLLALLLTASLGVVVADDSEYKTFSSQTIHHLDVGEKFFLNVHSNRMPQKGEIVMIISQPDESQAQPSRRKAKVLQIKQNRLVLEILS